MITVIDYDLGNLASVVKAFQYLQVPVRLTRKAAEIKQSKALVLPGVGAFGVGMNNLKKYSLVKLIKQEIKQGKPFLGICLGLQLLFTSSEENPNIKGLNILEGQVKRFNKNLVTKIPQIGWNQLKVLADDPLFKREQGKNFYFVHSYYVEPLKKESILAKTVYGKQEFVSVVRKGNLWGVQFHPEKSSQAGLQVLKRFSEVVFNGSNSGN